MTTDTTTDTAVTEASELAAIWSQWPQNPDFAALTQSSHQQPDAVVAMFRQRLADMQAAVEQQLVDWSASSAIPTYAQLLELREQAGDGLFKAWGLVHHLIAVADNPQLREIRDTFQPEMVQVSSAWGQDPRWYALLQKIVTSPSWPELSGAQQRAIVQACRQAERAGVALPAEQQQIVRDLQSDLAAASSTFGNHILDATAAWRLELNDPAQVAGLPQFLLAATAAAAKQHGVENATAEEGPWFVGLDMSVAGAFLSHAQDRSLREQLYRQLVARAAPGSDFDNAPIIEELRHKRFELAQALGFADYATLSLSGKMAETPAAAMDLLETLRAAALPKAQAELDELTAFAADQGAETPLQPWDLTFGVSACVKIVLPCRKRPCGRTSRCLKCCRDYLLLLTIYSR